MSRVSDQVDRAEPAPMAPFEPLALAGHPLADASAVDCLRQGGRATDAAVRAALVLAVVEPTSAAIAGDACALVWDKDAGIAGLDGSGRWAASGRAGSIKVPGALRAFEDLLERYGTTTLGEHLEHAAALAGAERPALAAALAAIASHGTRRFYEGELAAAMVAHTAELGGFSASDLSGHRSRWSAPVEGVYRGHSVFALGEGGLVELEALALLDDFPIADLPAAEREHLAIEAIGIAIRDAAAGPLDPRDFVADAYLERRRDEMSARAPAAPSPRETCDAASVCVVDREGQCCALGLSSHTSFGAGVAVPNTGLVLSMQTRRSDAPIAHRRAPFVVFREGLPWIVGGASRAAPPSLVVQTLLRAIDLGLAPPDAVGAPRWSRLDELRFERGFDESVIAALEARGHAVARDAERFGDVQLIAIDRAARRLVGATDPRRAAEPPP
jgi:gamma-glutamyltranspeptidase